MNLAQFKTTNRKFYNKWLYKITLTLKGASVLRYDLNKVEEFCTDDRREIGSWSWHTMPITDKEFIKKLVNFLQNKSSDTWSKRVERSIVDFYTNDKDFYDELSELAGDRIRHRFQPDRDSISVLQESPLNVAVSKYPHDRYQHKVYLLPHKMKDNKEEKIKYIQWLKKQCPKVTCTSAIEKWFIATDWNWDRRYILVEDESMLLILKLRNSDVIGRVYNYILCDK